MPQYAEDFKTLVDIENIRINNFMAFIDIHFITPKKSDVDKSYRLWVEDLDRKGMLTIATNEIFYIDKCSDVNSSAISVNRNYTANIRLSLLGTNIVDNRLVRRVRFHLKENQFGQTSDRSVWISDEKIIASTQIKLPVLKVTGCARRNKKLYVKIDIQHKTAFDEVSFNQMCQVWVHFFDGNNLINTEQCSSFKITEDKVVIGSNQDYGSNVTKIGIEIRYVNGCQGEYNEYTVDVIDGIVAYAATEEHIIKAKTVRIGYRSTTGELKYPKVKLIKEVHEI